MQVTEYNMYMYVPRGMCMCMYNVCTLCIHVHVCGIIMYRCMHTVHLYTCMWYYHVQVHVHVYVLHVPLTLLGQDICKFMIAHIGWILQLLQYAHAVYMYMYSYYNLVYVNTVSVKSLETPCSKTRYMHNPLS